MADGGLGGEDVQALRAEIVRLNKMVRVLMDRVERSTSLHASDFDRFQGAVMLEERVRGRTLELEQALRENERINRALREAEQQFHSVLDQSLVGITLVIGKRFHYVNPKFAEIVGYSIEEIVRLGPADIIQKSPRLRADDIPLHAGVFGGAPIGFTAEVLRKDGKLITVEVSGNTPIDVGGEPALIAVWADITERLKTEREVKALQDQLRDQAIHDPLTGLYNRLYLNESLERELGLAQRQGYPVSVIMADIDYFKAVNDCHGHLAGDAALKHFAAIMKRDSRASDINCRFGGEEFFLVLPNTPELTACERAEQLRLALAAQALEYQSLSIAVTASFGVAAYPACGTSGNDLIYAADLALYAAKDAGRNRVKRYLELARS